MSHTFNNTPNTNAPFEILTSYDSDLVGSAGSVHGAGDAGFGSLMRRNVATDIVMYKPYDNSLDTLIQTTGGFEVATNSVHEWTENDELLDDEATLDTAVDSNDINHGSYSASATATLQLSTANVVIFRKGDVIRYVTSAGAYQYALITDISSPEVSITVIDSGDTLGAATGAAVIQRMHSLRGSDRNYDVESRGSIPKQYYTYINKIVHDTTYGRRVQNEEHYLQLLEDQENKLFGEMRRSRELQSLYGVKGKYTLSNGDIVYSSPGLYTQIADFNKDTASMTTSSTFDSTKFLDAIYDWISHNFGGESGGPKTRTVFISARFADFLSRAFQDRQRFYEIEYVAGVRCMRFEHNLGNIDFIYLPVLDYKHPLPNGSVKESAPKAVAMMCPVNECVTRLVMQGEGSTSEVFKINGGDEEETMRVKTTEGLKLKLKQYCAVLEEV
jgi:hypothetical protein